MSLAKYDESCPGCRPVLVKLDGTRFAADSPEMQAVNTVWEKTTEAERRAFHDVCCVNSRAPQDIMLAGLVQQRILQALQACTNEEVVLPSLRGRETTVVKQGSPEQLALNERRCKWSAICAALGKMPIGAVLELPMVALEDTNRLRCAVSASKRSDLFRYKVSALSGVVRVTKVSRWSLDS